MIFNRVKGLILSFAILGFYVFFRINTSLFLPLQFYFSDSIAVLRYRTQQVPSNLKDIVLVAIDEESMERVGERWPWDRAIMADVVNKLSKVSPKIICIDLVFNGRTNLDSDTKLADSLARAGNVMIASYVWEGEQVLASDEDFVKNALGMGLVNKSRDKDFSMRKFLAVRFSRSLEIVDYAMEVKAVAALLKARLNIAPERLQFLSTDTNKPLLSFPLKQDGFIPIRFVAGLSDLVSIPIYKIIDEPLPDFIKDKIILIGQTASIFHDYHPTPIGNQNGVVVMANSLLTLLNGWTVREVPVELQAFLVFLCALIMGLIISRWSPFRSLLVVCLVLLVFAGASIWAYFNDYKLDLVGIPFVVLSTYILGTIARSISLAIESTRLRLQATTDSLTGIANLRYLQVRLEHEIERVKRYGVPLSIIMFDVDGFKGVNDKHGHGCGNDILKEITEILRQQTRSADLIARYGGDEFCVLLFHTDSGGASVFAERLRLSVEKHIFKTRVGDIKLTLSIGVTSLEGGSSAAWESLLEQADVALYESKGLGKNRVTVFHPKNPK
jgi:diguanylate cyclase (GGDEF)-like protein